VQRDECLILGRLDVFLELGFFTSGFASRHEKAVGMTTFEGQLSLATTERLTAATNEIGCAQQPGLGIEELHGGLFLFLCPFELLSAQYFAIGQDDELANGLGEGLTKLLRGLGYLFLAAFKSLRLQHHLVFA
jgi:hypothetical protein